MSAVQDRVLAEEAWPDLQRVSVAFEDQFGGWPIRLYSYSGPVSPAMWLISRSVPSVVHRMREAGTLAEDAAAGKEVERC